MVQRQARGVGRLNGDDCQLSGLATVSFLSLHSWPIERQSVVANPATSDTYPATVFREWRAIDSIYSSSHTTSGDCGSGDGTSSKVRPGIDQAYGHQRGQSWLSALASMGPGLRWSSAIGPGAEEISVSGY